MLHKQGIQPRLAKASQEGNQLKELKVCELILNLRSTYFQMQLVIQGTRVLILYLNLDMLLSVDK